jgi:hypothetical protein
MNSMNRFCQVASLICLLILVIEGNLFVHNIASQARAIEPQMTTTIDAPHPGHAGYRWFLCLSDRG